MSDDWPDVEGRVIPGGGEYRDEYVIEKVYGEYPDQFREEIWRGYKGQLIDLYYASKELVEREVKTDG